MEMIERHVTISNEALAVFVRFWLTSTPALPDTSLAAAQNADMVRVRGTIQGVDGQTLDVKGRDGAPIKVVWTPPGIRSFSRASALMTASSAPAAPSV